MREPKSMSELVYFTRRKDEFGLVKLWVFREDCTKCVKLKWENQWILEQKK